MRMGRVPEELYHVYYIKTAGITVTLSDLDEAEAGLKDDLLLWGIGESLAASARHPNQR